MDPPQFILGRSKFFRTFTLRSRVLLTLIWKGALAVNFIIPLSFDLEWDSALLLFFSWISWICWILNNDRPQIWEQRCSKPTTQRRQDKFDQSCVVPMRERERENFQHRWKSYIGGLADLLTVFFSLLLLLLVLCLGCVEGCNSWEPIGHPQVWGKWKGWFWLWKQQEVNRDLKNNYVYLLLILLLLPYKGIPISKRKKLIWWEQ